MARREKQAEGAGRTVSCSKLDTLDMTAVVISQRAIRPNRSENAYRARGEEEGAGVPAELSIKPRSLSRSLAVHHLFLFLSIA